ncbi:hypothetical protein C359_02932 [Cryptococcus neoformans Bt120]|nr:hypothetical protein C359_02932 [Cryptococcus neoformans var. grubii Bt120]
MTRKVQKTSTVTAAIAALAALPRAFASLPAARWGHQGVYVKSKKAMYIVGGETSASGYQITNEVLVLPLDSSNPSFTTGSSDGLPAHAFASVALSNDENSLVVMGGMTSDCSSDGLAHTLDLSNDDEWASTSPSKFMRRRGAGMAWVDNNSTYGEFMVIGGIADSYSCSSSTSAYTAADVLSLPLSSSALVSSRSLPKSLTGSTLAVSDFGLASDSSGKIYLAGGQSSSGDLVSLDTIGIWDSTSGWQSQTTSGDVPDGRIGASLVAHPNLDMLVLHGGSVSNSTSGSYSSTSLLAFLNTTTFEWSIPSNLQPPSSSATSYHSAVMTDQGVMITAFGLSASGTPRSDVYYLDLRDTVKTSWTWKSNWNSNMLEASSGSSTNTSSTANGVTAADAKSSSGMSSKKLASIIVPILVVALLLSPLLVYLIRRRVRVIKKRRMAQHFSFSSQEDSGAFNFRTPFNQYLAKRRSEGQFPIGDDSNEREGNFVSGVTGTLGRMVSRLSNRSSDSGHEDAREIGETERQMAQVGQRVRINLDDAQPMNWEEIDFGLGKLDESKGHDSSYNASSRALVQDGQNPVSSAAEGYTDDQLYALEEVPSEAANVHAQITPNALVTAYPVMEPSPAYTPHQAGDWTKLQEDLTQKPAFRSISPTAQLRSHSHPARAAISPFADPVPASETLAINRSSSLTRTVSQAPSIAPSIPPFEFQRVESPGGTITLVNPQNAAQTQEVLPFASAKDAHGTHRSVSQPISRQLIDGRLARRGSAPSSSGSHSGSESGEAQPTKTLSHAKGRAVSANHAPQVRRSSSSSAGTVKYPSASRRKTQLRVVNLTESEED